MQDSYMYVDMQNNNVNMQHHCLYARKSNRIKKKLKRTIKIKQTLPRLPTCKVQLIDYLQALI